MITPLFDKMMVITYSHLISLNTLFFYWIVAAGGNEISLNGEASCYEATLWEEVIGVGKWKEDFAGEVAR